jgi:nucleolar protein 12
VAFAQPTATLPSESLSDLKKGREHDRARAASWREAHPEEEAALKQDAKRYQTPKEKKRVAAIRHDLHPEADSANVYMVFAHAKPGASLREADTAKDDSDSEEADSGVDKQPTQRASTLDPYEAARLAAQKCDGTSFLNRTLRVDVVHTPKSLSGSAETSSGTSPDGLFDPKRTVFVGNLDFASKEEDLRAFFEGVVARERGPPPSIESVNGKEEDEEDKGTRDGAWVARVRIVRDRDTQLGKGFAYVQFTVSFASPILLYARLIHLPAGS